MNRLVWFRGHDQINTSRADTTFVLGIRGSGKSSYLEDTGKKYLESGASVLDLFGSRDGENLAWLRSPYVQDKKFLLITGDNVSLTSSFNTRKVSQLRLSDFEKNDIIISSSPLYSSVEDEYASVNSIIDLIYTRLHYRKLIYCLVREAANLFYSRVKAHEGQLESKALFIYFLREARHMGCALGLDSLRFSAIDVDIRALIDFLVIKALGSSGLPKDLHWLYSIFDPRGLQNLPVSRYAIASRKGALGFGTFDVIPWHKNEGENILDVLGLRIEYGDRERDSEDKGAFQTVSDSEHAQIITSYSAGLSMNKIAGQSRSSRTVKLQIDYHNSKIREYVYCDKCQRAKNPLSAKQISKQRLAIPSVA